MNKSPKWSGNVQTKDVGQVLFIYENMFSLLIFFALDMHVKTTCMPREKFKAARIIKLCSTSLQNN